MTPKEQAINKTSGPCVIRAGAGTGKSYTIRMKIKKLLEEGLVAPEEILCLTFSNEATNDLRKKIAEDLGGQAQVTVKTFHSFCSDILREDGALLSLDTSFDLLLPEDASILLHSYGNIEPYWADRYVKTVSSIQDLGIDMKKIVAYRDSLAQQLKELQQGDIETVAQDLGLELNVLYLQDEDTPDEKKDKNARKKFLKKYLSLYEDYEKFNKFLLASEEYTRLKKERNYLDFSDLNVYVLNLFSAFGSEKYVDMYKYVFVDEFQDTNKLQFQLIEYIAKHKNITVVGDPNQSIYGFRGSYKDSFSHFKRSFAVDDDSEFYLAQSRRNPNAVLDVAHELIKNNYENPLDCQKIEHFQGEQGKPVQVIECVSDAEEARIVAEKVQSLIKEGVDKKEICILFRTHKQSRILREALELKDIPVIACGKTSLLHKREITTAISYLSILSNMYQHCATGDQAWWGLFHYNNSLSPADTIKIGRYLKKHRSEELAIDELLLASIENLSLSDEGKRIVERVVSKLQFLVSLGNKALPDLVLDIYELSGLNRAFSYKRSVQNIEALLNLKRFHELAENFFRIHSKSLPKFIEYLETIEKMGVTIPTQRIQHIDAVRLMTIHAVKGLEFDHVIVTNLAQDRFPVTRTQKEPLIPVHLRPYLQEKLAVWKEEGLSESALQNKIKEFDKQLQIVEERRLAYVAFTRAKKELVLTWARSYNAEADSAQKSVFLKEIEDAKFESIIDDSEDALFFTPTSSFEKHKEHLKQQIVQSLDTESLPSVVERVIYYLSCREEKALDVKNLLARVEVHQEELSSHLKRVSKEKSLLNFDNSVVLSPSSMKSYLECPKKFELKHLLHMPEQGDFDGELQGSSMGSFVHKVLEDGVLQQADSLEAFEKIATTLHEEPDWNNIPLEQAFALIKVFWERNRDKFNEKSRCEMK
ncbi:MAG: ATP-dependent DNA helicase, partial [Candidatus Nanoarchaeia archaeon]